MRRQEGFSSIELLVTIPITALLGLAAAMSIHQTINVIQLNDTRQVMVSQLQNAGYSISRDAQMAETIITTNLAPGEFVRMNWTEWEDTDGDWKDADPVYHSVTYFFEGLTGGIGAMRRNDQTSTGINRDTLIAERIYYDPADPADTSSAQYQDQVLTMKLAVLYGDAREVREYRTTHRPSY